MGTGPRPPPPACGLEAAVPAFKPSTVRENRAMQVGGAHIAGAVINRQVGTPAHLHLPVSPSLWAELGFLTASFGGVGYSRPEPKTPRKNLKASPID